MTEITDVVEFEISGTLYALDIQLTREIIEILPITPIPCTPPFIEGIINLRGEITNILNLRKIMGLSEKDEIINQKIIVLMPEAAGGSKTGIIVDDVHSVIRVSEDDIEKMDNAISGEAFVKGIIKQESISQAGPKGTNKIIIWIDLEKIIRNCIIPDNKEIYENAKAASDANC
ncbi:chemotaxis protein CheW [Methanoplanus sp. FWC-SCC4]|uniref:Chemotaxis protein CheW n=1 Tax=Methanochimaera problematica TaxID=2609417 RepID=A0AA97I3D3_9EURY|nr:chemotaxis protein CheW [Methanoplanus sp. FWC-SCC4]WOF17235.1 chemotaxis protein CheW [Methanoplanus sp. FWC-SCC4]